MPNCCCCKKYGFVLLADALGGEGERDIGLESELTEESDVSASVITTLTDSSPLL